MPDAIVAPFTGAWIEIKTRHHGRGNSQVAPFTGAWIEISMARNSIFPGLSLPSRERGLKYPRFCP